MSRLSIYLASSWRNEQQPAVLAALREAGHEVYDFRNPGDEWAPPGVNGGASGFRWSDVDPEWESWTPRAFVDALRTPTARRGFRRDWFAMGRADVCVLLLPCGRSAHLEAGYFVGHPRKRLHILVPELTEPELMYAMAQGVHTSLDDLIGAL